MKITDLFALLGGLGLFLYGMQMMSNGLEAAAGNRMKKILEKLTANRFLGVLAGALFTAAIQSSSAATVMVIGFVNSGMMRLDQAVWLIMGANIGTTITGQLIALDIGALAPLFAFLGVAFIVFVKNQKCHHYGMIAAGLGILFIGMDMMSSSMMPLRESEAFISMMTGFTNPILGILAGALFTAVIQSSSASVGILQALAASGVIGLPQAVYVLFGQNIGTCITAVLASVGTSRNAKRTTVIHLMFNLIGTAIFTFLCVVTPLTSWVEGFTPGNASLQIANMHTLFNIVTTVLLLPFGVQMAKIATKILPDVAQEESGAMQLKFITPVIPIENRGETKIGLSAIAVTAIRNELRRMTAMAKDNVLLGFDIVKKHDASKLPDIRDREEYIDYLNHEISAYISKILVKESNPDDAQLISSLFRVCGNLERIGDHALNIGEYIKIIAEKEITFSKEVNAEILEMQNTCGQAMDMVKKIQDGESNLHEIEQIEDTIDQMTEQFRKNQLSRMSAGKCSEEGCVIYSEMLTDFERIGDHILNIGQELALGVSW